MHNINNRSVWSLIKLLLCIVVSTNIAAAIASVPVQTPIDQGEYNSTDEQPDNGNAVIPAYSALLLSHTIINDSGGSAQESDFEVYIDGKMNAWDTNISLAAGSYKIAITALSGYKSSQWRGDCAADGSVEVALGQVARCEIVSNDRSVDLVVDKSVSDISAKVGDVVTFSILVSNMGPDTASNVKVVDVVTTGLKYQPGSMFGSNSLSDIDPYTNGLKWVINELPVGVPVNLSFDALILSP